MGNQPKNLQKTSISRRPSPALLRSQDKTNSGVERILLFVSLPPPKKLLSKSGEENICSSKAFPPEKKTSRALNAVSTLPKINLLLLWKLRRWVQLSTQQMNNHANIEHALDLLCCESMPLPFQTLVHIYLVYFVHGLKHRCLFSLKGGRECCHWL